MNILQVVAYFFSITSLLISLCMLIHLFKTNRSSLQWRYRQATLICYLFSIILLILVQITYDAWKVHEYPIYGIHVSCEDVYFILCDIYNFCYWACMTLHAYTLVHRYTCIYFVTVDRKRHVQIQRVKVVQACITCIACMGATLRPHRGFPYYIWFTSSMMMGVIQAYIVMYLEGYWSIKMILLTLKNYDFIEQDKHRLSCINTRETSLPCYSQVIQDTKSTQPSTLPTYSSCYDKEMELPPGYSLSRSQLKRYLITGWTCLVLVDMLIIILYGISLSHHVPPDYSEYIGEIALSWAIVHILISYALLDLFITRGTPRHVTRVFDQQLVSSA